MSAINILTSVVIVLEFCNIFLLTLLLVTPAPKHTMVKTLIVSCLLRSVLDVLPPIVYKLHPLELGAGQIQEQSMINFCIADSILLRYATVVKSAFAVSFTLPCLWLAIVQIRPRSADDYPRLTRRTVLVLCVAPFVWALPVIITSLPRIIRGDLGAQGITFNINSCYFDDPAFAIVSLIFTLLPLVMAVVTTIVMILVVWRFSDTMLEHTGWLFVKSKRFARFATLVAVTILSATLYAIVIANWIDGSKVWAHGQWGEHPVWTMVVWTSIVWEAITPMLFFAIFAAQKEIWETWFNWLSLIIALARKPDGHWGHSLHVSQHVGQETLTASRSGPTCDTIAYANDELAAAKMRPIIPGRIIPRPLSSFHQARNSSPCDGRRGALRSLPGTNGLSPPPRNGGICPVEEQLRPSRSYLPFMKGISLTTFGSQYSSHQHSSSFGHSAEACAPSSTTESYEWVSRESIRPDTPGSSRTFGRSGVTRSK